MRTIVIAAVLVLLFCIVFYPNTAYAVCPENYIESVESNDLDWYMDALDIDWVANRVESMLQDSANYDFSALESNPVIIAIIDTGINYQHEIFQGKYDENGKPTNTDGIGEYDVFLRDSDGNIISKDMIYLTNDANDDSNDKHGTHVAGIVATLIHKLNLEKYIKIMPIKASYLDKKESKFSASVLKDAVDFALKNGADVINLSLSDTGISTFWGGKSEYDFITQDMANKAIFVAAAGNNGTSSSSRYYFPAANEYVIGVMNYKIDGEKIALSSKSNYGLKYDICFPGSNIYSADGSGVNGYKELGGTSMAAPICSFACALKTLQNRATCQKSGAQPLSMQDISDIVVNSYTNIIEKDKFQLKVFDFKKLIPADDTLQVYADKNKVYVTEDKTDSVTFTAFTQEQADLSKVAWSVKNEQGEVVCTGSGKKFTFEPQFYGCSYDIVATLECDGEILSATIQIAVVFMQNSYGDDEFYYIDVSFSEETFYNSYTDEDGNITIPSGSTLGFSISELWLYNLSDAEIIWYVNGEEVCIGKTFENVFQTEGEYHVHAKVNGVLAHKKNIIVLSAQSDDVTGQNTLNYWRNALNYCCILLCVFIVFGFVLGLLLRYLKSRSV